jgi:hypothetical protein
MSLLVPETLSVFDRVLEVRNDGVHEIAAEEELVRQLYAIGKRVLAALV